MKINCDEVVVQFVVRTYDDSGQPINEQITQAVKVFRNSTTQDFWSIADKAAATAQQVSKA